MAFKDDIIPEVVDDKDLPPPLSDTSIISDDEDENDSRTAALANAVKFTLFDYFESFISSLNYCRSAKRPRQSRFGAWLPSVM